MLFRISVRCCITLCGEPNIPFYGWIIIIIKKKNWCMSLRPTQGMHAGCNKKHTHTHSEGWEGAFSVYALARWAYTEMKQNRWRIASERGIQNQNSIDRCLIALAFLLSCCCQLSLKKKTVCLFSSITIDDFRLFDWMAMIWTTTAMTQNFHTAVNNWVSQPIVPIDLHRRRNWQQ